MFKEENNCKTVVSGSEIMSVSGIEGRKEPLWISMATTIWSP